MYHMNRICILCFVLFSLSMLSQDNRTNYVIDFITTKQGLSHNYVPSIVSDDLNMKWIGTENGITKFNGYDYEYIKPSDTYDALLNENIEVLFMDEASNLWIGTKSGGLSYFDIKNNAIKNYNHLIDLDNEGDLRITAISQDQDGHIWVGTWQNGVFVIDFKNDVLVNQYQFYQAVYSIERDFHDNMWFSSGNRVHMFDWKKKTIVSHNLRKQVTDVLSDESRNRIWIAVAGDDTKLYSYDCSTTSIDTLETHVPSNFSRKLSLDKYDRLWIGTWGRGVYRSNETMTAFSKIDLISSSSDKISANYNTILSIHHDRNNVTWLATANGGVVKLLEGNGFENADQLITDKNLKSNLNCTSIYKNEASLFVGTFYGLYHGKHFSDLTLIDGIGIVKVNVLYEHQRKLYIGTADGFHIYDLDKDILIYNSKGRLNKVTSFLIENNTLYIGSQQLGLAVMNLNQLDDEDRYTIYSEQLENANKIESNRITSIKKDDFGNIWVSSYNGLHLYDRDSKTFIHQSRILEGKLPSVIINATEIKGSNIWLATPNGLIKLNYNGNQLIIEDIITQNDGLNSDFICSLTFDEKSNLWLSTHTEIVRYNPYEKIIISYGDINGVRSTSFNNKSFFNYKNEEIYFGGIDNITFFNPGDIKDFNTVPEIIFTTLRVNNEVIQYKTGNPILDENFNYASSIKLTHREDFFSTQFVSNDFLGKLNVKYKYILEGYQDEWIELQNRNEINFAALSPGTYTLKVIASRDNQHWSEPKALTITLSGSPWLSAWALFFYVVVLVAIIVYLVQSNNYKLRLQNKLEIARIDREKEMELTEAKLNFFTNISHEFRSPLSLIVGPIKELLDIQNLPAKVNKNLHYIDKNTNRLLNLINQLLDFRKADHGLLKLSVSQGNFVRFSREVFLYFKEAAKAKGVAYDFKSYHDDILFPFDRNKMEIVLCNILSNAIKYTESGDAIVMEIDKDAEFCVIAIMDTGIGIRAEDMEKIFDRFFQIKSANSARMVGSGIGLSFSKKIIELHHGSISVESKPGEGSTFIIKLAMDPKLYRGSFNEHFMTSDDMNGYNTIELPEKVENLSLEAKEHTILVIDDNVEILAYLKDILSDDYNIIQADNGDLGYQKASSDIPDLIVSDIMMPGKDGITLCKELKSQLTTSHIPIILLTARTSTVFEIEGLKTGADDYVSKPFNAKVIRARIESLLENREKIRAHFLNKVRFEPTAASIEHDADTENTFIHQAILLVENNLDNPSFGIDQMVDELCMSQSTLYRKIKSLTGLSLTAFIRSIRLKKSAQLILSSDLNLNQIAYEVGFNDYKYFKNSFKKQFNCVPSKYKALICKS